LDPRLTHPATHELRAGDALVLRLPEWSIVSRHTRMAALTDARIPRDFSKGCQTTKDLDTPIWRTYVGEYLFSIQNFGSVTAKG
jgi:hypothetical protein